jgi:hypothetical protein
MDAWVWILLVVIIVAVVVAFVASRSRQRENRRTEAADLRDPNAEHHMQLREKDAAAAASEAEARRVRAEADQRAAEAQRLDVEAQRASLDRDTAAEQSREQLRRADALDPDVRTDREGYRLDEDGNRVETPAERAGAGFGGAAAAGAGGVAAGAGAGALAGSDDDADRSLNREAGVDRPGATPGEHGRAPGLDDDDTVDAPTSTRIGNFRDLDDERASDAGEPTTAATVDSPRTAVTADDDRPGVRPDDPVAGERSGEAEGSRPEHRIGNFRGLDEPDSTSTDSETDIARDPRTAEEGAVEEDQRSVLDKARDKVDDVLGRRDPDAPERRQPE